MALLSVNSVCKSFASGLFREEKKKILQDITFAVQQGEVLGLTGASGSGKSTLIRCIMRLIPVDSGEILLGGTDLLKLPANEMMQKRRELQMLFQNPVSALNPRKIIRDSMEEPIKIHQLGNERKEEIPGILKKLQLKKELLDRYPYQLSGGELQRLCLGRLLLLRPKLLLLDEPTSMLDVSVQAQIITILQENDFSAFGLVNAVTRSSQDVADYNRATDLERLGGTLLEESMSSSKNKTNTIILPQAM